MGISNKRSSHVAYYLTTRIGSDGGRMVCIYSLGRLDALGVSQAVVTSICVEGIRTE